MAQPIFIPGTMPFSFEGEFFGPGLTTIDDPAARAAVIKKIRKLYPDAELPDEQETAKPTPGDQAVEKLANSITSAIATAQNASVQTAQTLPVAEPDPEEAAQRAAELLGITVEQARGLATKNAEAARKKAEADAKERDKQTELLRKADEARNKAAEDAQAVAAAAGTNDPASLITEQLWDELHIAGLADADAVKTATDETLSKIPGVSPAVLGAIRKIIG